MPIAFALFLIDIIFIVHAAKTGRFSPWGYLILLLPGVGALAYDAARVQVVMKSGACIVASRTGSKLLRELAL